MKLKNISFIILMILIVTFIVPENTQAYFSTNRTAQRITNQTALYTIDFSFGFTDRDVYIPVVARRTSITDITKPYVGYTFTSSEKGNPLVGTAVGMVLSNMEIVDSMYKVPAGTKGDFKLAVFLTADTDTPRAKYGMQVTNLPYITKTQDITKNLGLNIYELGVGTNNPHTYHTKQIGLNL